MLPSILIVDDENEVLKALERLLRKDYRLFLYTDPAAALAFYQESPTHIVISDMRMPNINGAEFLKAVAESNPRSKRVVLTGFADLALAQQAINEGHVSYYLNKPWQNDELKSKLESLVTELKSENRQKALVKKLSLDKERLLAGQQVNALLTNVLLEEHDDTAQEMSKLKKISNELLQFSANLVAMHSDEVQGHSQRIAQQAKALLKRMGGNDAQCLAVYFAGLFYQIGLSGNGIKAPIFLQSSLQERLNYQSFAQASAKVMSSVATLKSSAKIVNYLFERADGKGIPEHLELEQIPLASQILHAAILLDLSIHGRYNGNIIEPAKAINILSEYTGEAISKKVFNGLTEMLDEPREDEQFSLMKSVYQLEPNMCLENDIVDEHNHKVLAEGTCLTEALIARLHKNQQHCSHTIVVCVGAHKVAEQEAQE